MGLTKRQIQLGLGVLWILDGALQLQPYMFTKAFAYQVILPQAVGQPWPLRGAVDLVGHLIAAHPLAFDCLFASTQLAIGLGLLLRRSTKAALLASMAWGIGVWVFGEGLGGIFVGGANLFNGAPGAVLFYLVLAAAAWPGKQPDRRGLLPAWTRWAWVATWLLYGALFLLPGSRTGGKLAADLVSSLAGMPNALVQASRDVASWLSGLGAFAGEVMALLCLAIGLGAAAPMRYRGWAYLAGGILALCVWMLAEGFGGIPTGTATDPNSGPLLVLLAMAAASAEPKGALFSRPGWLASILGAGRKPPLRASQPGAA